jgi:thiosulfate/3-mercaptopyruvate sulfurtransferase
MNHPLLIDTETLEQNLGREGLVVIDVRGKAAYEYGGHIPGAVHATWHEFSDPNAAAKGLLDPDVRRLERRIRALGVSDDSDIVIYSNPFDNWGDEGRMFWLLEYLGLSDLRILDGGWVKWVAEKRRYGHGMNLPTPGTFNASPRQDRIALKDELKRLVKRPHPETMIVDARSVEEFVGKEMAGIPRPGHIPSAVNIPWNAFLNSDATLKDIEVIGAILDEKGLHPSHEVVCYCTGGVRSGWVYFVLKVMGYTKVKNYPGSWWEWSRDFAAPAETDAKVLHKILNPEASRPS